jgi:hypothetical protein
MHDHVIACALLIENKKVSATASRGRGCSDLSKPFTDINTPRHIYALDGSLRERQVKANGGTFHRMCSALRWPVDVRLTFNWLERQPQHSHTVTDSLA